MKKLQSCGILLFLLIITTALSYAQFEGSLKMKSSQQTTRGTVNANQEMFIKGNKVRMNTVMEKNPMGTVYTILRGDKGVVWTVIDAMKMYMEMSLKSADEIAQKSQQDESNVTVKKTGKTQTILGYQCDEILITSDDMTATFWGTKELASLVETMKTMNSQNTKAQPKWGKEIAAMKVYPLKYHVEDKKMGTTEFEVLSVEKKPVADSMFEVHEGYTKQAMPGMPSQSSGK